jgi:hypothetical protein
MLRSGLRTRSVAALLRPALLNDQPRAQFRVDDVSKTDFCTPFKVSAASHKYSLDIRGQPVSPADG